jgi:2-C-methyl-D-erythritol 2,4-cyclodiphosphate synthase
MMDIRVSIGQDSHRFAADGTEGKCILGGAVFEDAPPFIANSDGDVVLHAVTNAVSGITCRNILGDIADKMCRGGITDSREYLAVAMNDLARAGFEVVNLSVTIEGKRPRILPKVDQLRRSIGSVLGVAPDRVGITATTGEGLTAFGRGEGVSVFCVLTVKSTERVVKHTLSKVNLTLDVVGLREDGYHDIRTLFQPVSLSDELTVCRTDGDDLIFECSEPGLEADDNIVCKAYRLMKERFPAIGGCRAALVKNVPSGAGLGGGSGDAASMLEALNELYGLRLSDRELMDMGAKLGADVPALILKGASIGEGIGEKLTAVKTGSVFHLVFIKPKEAYPTGKMYRELDRVLGFEDQADGTPDAPDGCETEDGGKAGTVAGTEDDIVIDDLTGKAAAGLEHNDLDMVCEAAFNVFELAVPDKEGLSRRKAMLMEAGAKAALLTGSGSCVYGIFENLEAAQAAMHELERSLPEGDLIYLGHTVNQWKEWS